MGGISVYAGICFTFGIADYYIPHAALYLACAGVLVLVGALDDRFDISVKFRATVQAAIGIIMMVVGGPSSTAWAMCLVPGSWWCSAILASSLTLFGVWAGYQRL